MDKQLAIDFVEGFGEYGVVVIRHIGNDIVFGLFTGHVFSGQVVADVIAPNFVTESRLQFVDAVEEIGAAQGVAFFTEGFIYE